MKRTSLPLQRRQFITLLGGAAAWPAAARAQQPDRMRRIGVLMAIMADDSEAHARLAPFAQRLQLSGWIMGQNIRIDYSWAGVNADECTAVWTNGKLAPELVWR